MIRPESLLRSDSGRDEPVMIAPARNFKEEEIDCGIILIPFCCPAWMQRLATPRCLMAALIALAMLLGNLEGYIYATMQHVGAIFQYPPYITAWLLIAGGAFQGVIALVVAAGSARVHRPAWLGGLTCMLAVACCLVPIPYLQHVEDHNGTLMQHDIGPWLCVGMPLLELYEEIINHCWIMLVVTVILNIFIVLVNISYWTHGLTYLDDNVPESHSPVYIAVLLGMRITSIKGGYTVAWLFLQTPANWWIAYYIFGSLFFIVGVAIACFPAKLLNTMLKQTAASILDIASGHSDMSLDEENEDLTLYASLRRVLSNRIIILNSISLTLLITAMGNFDAYETKYLEAQYHIPYRDNFEDPWTSRLVTSVLKGPIFMLATLVAGLIFAKYRPDVKKITMYNALVALKIGAAFLALVFMDCQTGRIAGEDWGHFVQPFCSHDCGCSTPDLIFDPVCVVNAKQTYFSPCHAGCKDVEYVNDILTFANCSCGINPNVPVLGVATRATPGACDNAGCFMMWIFYHIMSVFLAAFLGSSLVGHVLLTLRAVRPADKALAVGFLLTLIGLVAYVPGGMLYKFISDSSCRHWNVDGYTCNLHTSSFGDAVCATTGGLALASAGVALLVWRVGRRVELYEGGVNATPRLRPSHTELDSPTYIRAEEQPLSTPPEVINSFSRVYRTTQI